LKVKGLVKVLLVDDEREFVAILCQRLTQKSYLVSSAHSGEDALAQLEKNQDVEVVVLDIKMPGLDGIETLKLIKKKWPLVEVIMLTGHSTLNSAIDSIKLGAYDFLLKPTDIGHLIAKLEKAAGRKRHRDRLILGVHMMPYITPREREKMIADILDPATQSSVTEVDRHEEF
jgi:DNA-binding NtrC family response regulator